MCVLLMSGVQASLSPSVSHCLSNKARGLVLPVSDPRAVVPSMWLELLTPQGESPPKQCSSSSESPPRGTVHNLIPSPPFLPDSMCSFVIALVVQESFFQSLVSFCSTGRCMIDTFMGGGEFYIFLLGHLGLLSGTT